MKRLTEFISSVRATLVAGLAILICAGIVLALSTREEDAILEAAFDQQQYASHMERQVGSIEHIVDQYLLDQARYLPVATPDPDFIHIESGGILPFDPADFPREFIQSLVPETNGAITTCEITVYEDLKTRERKILNSRNQVIATVKAEKDYDPVWYVKSVYPDVFLSDDEERIKWLTQVYDPSRIAIRYQLIEKDELIELVWKNSLQAIEQTEDGGGMLLGGRSGAGVTNLKFIATEPLTNGTVELTLAWPTNSLSTNAIDIFVSTNMLEEIWQIALTTNLSTETNTFTWIDTEADVHPARFYDCWTLHDSDSDELSDGRERRLYLTDPLDSDSDDDGINDGDEVENRTDPNNDDTTPPLITMTSPSNDWKILRIP